jgi:predicted DNA-binding transcriptional regulator AlpA
MKKANTVQPNQAGFRIKEFSKACGFSRSAFYNLPDDQKPKLVKIGRATVIIETPAEFLQRLALTQQIAA